MTRLSPSPSEDRERPGRPSAPPRPLAGDDGPFPAVPDDVDEVWVALAFSLGRHTLPWDCPGWDGTKPEPTNIDADTRNADWLRTPACRQEVSVTDEALSLTHCVYCSKVAAPGPEVDYGDLDGEPYAFHKACQEAIRAKSAEGRAIAARLLLEHLGEASDEEVTQ